MADLSLTRTTKLGHEWGAYELRAYHITVSQQTKQEFFGMPHLPPPDHPKLLVDFMNTQDRRQVAGDTKKLVHYLDIALYPCFGHDAAVVNLMAKLLETLGYDDDHRIIFIHHSLPFSICGASSLAEIDIYVLADSNEVLMLVRDDQRLLKVTDPEPEVIAGAIAAYAANNKAREAINIPPLNTITLPAITMMGTSPIFYKIPVTAELSEAVSRGMYPTTETRVLRYFPQPPIHAMGMSFPEDRAEILACLHAFKHFL
ncbi:hypothetical protein DFH29DRAFT_906593 [Suillus ampliporus]|nr:hypothetical protein DFH29DRAFT_906593 [Suillus ampliporus]